MLLPIMPIFQEPMFLYNFFFDTCKRLLTDADALAKVAAFGPDLIMADILSHCTTTLICE